MSKPKWTQGEWRAWKSPDGRYVVRAQYLEEGRRVTCFPAVCSAVGQENEPNATLISAAPDLYEALKQVLVMYEVCSELDENTFVKKLARAALAKALGETS